MTARTRFAAALGVAVLCALPAQAQIFVTIAGDPIVGVAATGGSATSTLATAGTAAGQNNYPAAESPPNAIDRNFATKYLNFAETNVGLIVNPSSNAPVIGLQFVTANDATERDPIQVLLEGTNDANATTTLNSAWTTIYSGDAGLTGTLARGTAGAIVPFANATGYDSYRLLVTSVRNGTAANSVQFAELGLISTIPEPSSMALCGLGLGALVRYRRKTKKSA